MPLPRRQGLPETCPSLICRGLPRRVPGASKVSVICVVGRGRDYQSAPCQPQAFWLLSECQGSGAGARGGGEMRGGGGESLRTIREVTDPGLFGHFS